METNNIETNLRNNTLFNLSLGSKELFHSNFLAGLFTFPDPEGLEFSKRFLTELFGSKKLVDIPPEFLNKVKYIKVDREKYNMDLIIELKSEEDNDLNKKYKKNVLKTIVIENKVKSLPELKQLRTYEKKYASKNIKATFVLLSLVKIEEKLKNEIDKVWTIINYEDVRLALENLLSEDSNIELPKFGINIELIDLIREYIAFLKELVKVGKLSELAEGETIEFCDAGKYRDVDFKKLRIHDLLYKLKYQQILNEIVFKFKKTKDLESLIDSPDTTHSYGFSNDSGFLDIGILVGEYKIDENTVEHYLTIQLQSNNLRYASVFKSKVLTKSKLDSLHNEIKPIIFTKWFIEAEKKIDKKYANKNKDNEYEKYRGDGPKSKKKTNLDELKCNQFQGKDYTFYYKYDVLNTEIEINDVVNCFRELAKYALSIRENLCLEVKSYLEGVKNFV